MVDWSKVKKEYIPANETPSKRTKGLLWDVIFAEIPKGQTLVLHEPEVNSGTVRAALQRRWMVGKFKNLHIVTRGRLGTATIYIINTEKPLAGSES